MAAGKGSLKGEYAVRNREADSAGLELVQTKDAGSFPFGFYLRFQRL